MKHSTRTTILVTGALIALVSVFAPPSAAGGDQWVIRVDEPFELDGKVYDEGALLVKHVRALNPVVALTEIWVGNECLGLIPAQRVAEPDGDDNSVLFERRGHLVLVGFAGRGHGVHGVYRFATDTVADSEAPMLVAAK